MGEVFNGLTLRRESEILDSYLMPAHAHMLISIPPKYAVSLVLSFIKGKNAIHIARSYHFSMVGRDEEAIRKYIREQEREDQRIDQPNLFK